MATIGKRKTEILNGIQQGKSAKELKIQDSEKEFYEINKKQFDMIGDKHATIAWAPVEE